MSNKKRGKRTNRRPSNATVIFLALLLVMLSGITAVYAVVLSKLDLINYESLGDIWLYTPDAQDEAEQPSSSSDISVGEYDELYQNGDVFNILFMGTDERTVAYSDARADSIILVSLNKKAETVKLVSLERGLPVKMPNGKNDIITNAFRYGGPAWVIDAVQTHLNVAVDKYVRVNFSSFEKIVNAIGGVDIDLSEKEAFAMNHDAINRRPSYPDVYEGLNHFDGYAALQYCRLRYIDSDWQRIERQRKTIIAMKKQALTLSPAKLSEAADVILPLVSTNLSQAEILSIIANLPLYLEADVEQMTIPITRDAPNTDYPENTEVLRQFLYGEE